jgi:hypothetical protein
MLQAHSQIIFITWDNWSISMPRAAISGATSRMRVLPALNRTKLSHVHSVIYPHE